MTLLILSYLGGVLTILSPCILPVLPFVFARADQPFLKSGLPLLLGMALTFALVATLAAVGGGWAVHANQYGRILALILLAFFGVTLLSRSLADRLTRPLVALGDRLSQGTGSGVGASLILGIATGLAVGAMRRTHPGIAVDRRGNSGCERQHHISFARLRRRCRNVACGGTSHRRPRVRGDEEIARRGRMGAARARRCRAARRRRHRVRPRHGFSHTPFARQHGKHRAEPDRQGAAGENDGDYARRRKRSAGRRAISLARRRDGMDQFAAADAAEPARQGRAGRFLDLFLHQLPARASLCSRLGGEVQGSWTGRDRRPFAGIRFRKRSRQRAPRGARSERDLSRRARRQSRDLAGVQQQLLARALFHRRRRGASARIISAKANTTNPRRSSSSF